MMSVETRTWTSSPVTREERESEPRQSGWSSATLGFGLVIGFGLGAIADPVRAPWPAANPALEVAREAAPGAPAAEGAAFVASAGGAQPDLPRPALIPAPRAPRS